MANSSMQAQFLDNLKAKLLELSWVKLVDFERIRLLSSDFKDDELPCIQIIDNGDQATPVQQRTDISWDLSLEVVMKDTLVEAVDQKLLMDRRLQVKRKIGEDPQMGLNAVPLSWGRMKHVKYIGSVTDLHLLEPHLMVRIDIQVLFEEPFVDEC